MKKNAITILAALLMMTCVFSCSKKGEAEEIEIETEEALVFATKTEHEGYFEYLDDSFLKLPWLKEMVEETRSFIEAGYSRHTTIHQCRYKDGIGFMLNSCVGCSDAGFLLVNIQGISVCYSNGWVDSCRGFNIDLESKKLVWEIQPNPPVTIEDLYEQPLDIINKCVQGKWKLHKFWDRLNHFYANTTVEISEKEVIVSGNEGLNFSFSYGWKKMEVSPPYTNMKSYTTYVMWNDEQNRAEWSFYTLRSDMLEVNLYDSGNVYTLIRVRDTEWGRR
ncbi:MAG: hypothetical protein FWE99_02190 [Bacteroidales bacterium]|nr:hypothetical protein [Bacteroidales bacterium]